MKRKIILLAAAVVFIPLAFYLAGPALAPDEPGVFDGERAMQDVEYQVSLGPRLPGEAAHAAAVSWMVAELREAGWETEVQESVFQEHSIRNVVARRGEGRPWVVLGAHYDSRMHADQDDQPENREMPVPGANDGASGVAVLLELARVLPEDLEASSWAGEVWLVFFDAEDNGNIEGWDWILGSQAFVNGLLEQPEPNLPDMAVIVDMIGDADLNIYKERNSDAALTDEIWAQAAALGYSEQFIPSHKYNILDDHLPFIRAGVPAVDIIDFDYPYWHTLEDTPDKVAPASLEAVGQTLLAWLLESGPEPAE